MAGDTKATIDHEEIRAWVEDRQGRPATVEQTRSGTEPGLLRIDFPGYSGQESLTDITWEEFFRKFEEESLAFVYQEETADGRISRFAKLVSRESANVQ